MGGPNSTQSLYSLYGRLSGFLEVGAVLVVRNRLKYNSSVTDFADRLCTLIESRLPLTVESDGTQDDWNVVAPAILVAAAQHLRAVAHLQETFPSGVIGWQLLRSLFEDVTTYAWVAAEPETRAARWLKYDYEYRLKLANDFQQLGEEFVSEAERQKIEAALPDVVAMPDLLSRTRAADEAWAETLQGLDDYLPEENRSFRRLYPLIYRNGSQFTHPSSHVVDRFVARADEQHLVIGDEQAPGRDLAVIGSGILAAGLTIAVAATPALAISLDEIRQGLAGEGHQENRR